MPKSIAVKVEDDLLERIETFRRSLERREDGLKVGLSSAVRRLAALGLGTEEARRTVDP